MIMGEKIMLHNGSPRGVARNRHTRALEAPGWSRPTTSASRHQEKYEAGKKVPDGVFQLDMNTTQFIDRRGLLMSLHR